MRSTPTLGRCTFSSRLDNGDRLSPVDRQRANAVIQPVVAADIRLLRHESQLVVSMMSLIDDVDAAVPRAPDEKMGLLAVAGDVLYDFEVSTRPAGPGRDPATQITVGSRRLDATTAHVQVTESVLQVGDGALVRFRRWEFALAPDDDLVIETEQTMRGGFEDERRPTLHERFARTLARALGFAVPEDDLGQGEY
jgi:hypothetical protein